ncbi:MAG: winged helix-turn-helix domain-containing protein [Acetobacteraceae bacterium]|nr:winged helix-turn-helix domain-containing protein [Acetobacteraceae bacterium]
MHLISRHSLVAALAAVGLFPPVIGLKQGEKPVARLGYNRGRCVPLPKHLQVLRSGVFLLLGGRAFDVLMALIEARGAVVSKDALMARVWPDRIVELRTLLFHPARGFVPERACASSRVRRRLLVDAAQEFPIAEEIARPHLAD